MSLKDVTLSRSDMFFLAPSSISIEPGFNLRENAETDLVDLIASMTANGFLKEKPLLVETVGENIFVRDGHRRLLAALAAGIEQIPCVVDRSAYADPIAVIARMLANNSGALPLAPWEEAEGFRRMRDLGATLADIGGKIGKTAAFVSLRLLTIHATKAMKSAWRKGALTTSELTDECREIGKAKKAENVDVETVEKKADAKVDAKVETETKRSEIAEKNKPTKKASESPVETPSEPERKRARTMSVSEIERAIDNAEKREATARETKSKKEEAYWRGVADGLRVGAQLETLDTLAEALTA